MVDDTTHRMPKHIVNAFGTYFAGIYNDSHVANHESSFTYPQTNASEYSELDIVFTFQEVETAVRSLPVNKAPGNDRIQNEHMRYGGRTLLLSLVNLFNAILQSGHIPTELRTGDCSYSQRRWQM
jgi:hypothetical protein